VHHDIDDSFYLQSPEDAAEILAAWNTRLT
jgi:hypothetical protein